MKKIIILCVMILALMAFSSCKVKQTKKMLPEKATVVEDLGDGWVIFELNEVKYLYNAVLKITWRGQFGYSSLTQIQD